MIPVSLVPLEAAKNLCRKWHYSDIFPPHCMVSLGFYDGQGLAGIAIWGWGTRPRHTIQRLFPSLDTKDYWELCRMCCRDDLPRNTESQMIAGCVQWFKDNQPDKQVLFTWADGIRGKPGYVYQAANWLYGGFITTEIYLTSDHEPVHPRLMITRFGSRSKEVWQGLKLKRIRGRQFRYCTFLCSHKRRKELLRESSVQWTTRYPKHPDLIWQIDAGEGSRETRDLPRVERSGQFRQSAFSSHRRPASNLRQKTPEQSMLFDDVNPPTEKTTQIGRAHV
jgi:hypothetical protein